MEFDPRKHPKDRLGRFAELLGKLKPGEAVHLPGGFKVQRNPSTDWVPRKDAAPMPPRKFLVSGPEQSSRHGHLQHSTPGSVASMVLDRSARSTHPDSLGGTRSYTTLAHFEAREHKVEGQRVNIQRSRAGQLPEPPQSPGTTKLMPEVEAKRDSYRKLAQGMSDHALEFQSARTPDNGNLWRQELDRELSRRSPWGSPYRD